MSSRGPIVALTVAAALAATLVAASADAGSVSGRIVYDDKVPNFRTLAPGEEQGCGQVPQTVATRVVVRVKNAPAGGGGAASSPDTVTLRNCTAEPRVVALQAGQSLSFKNSDGILHNLVGKGFNIGMPPTVSKTVTPKQPGVLSVKCDVHPWMNSYVAVMTHPYFAVVGSGESFQIGSLPAGSYEIEAWHETLGTRSARVQVPADGNAKVDLSF